MTQAKYPLHRRIRMQVAFFFPSAREESRNATIDWTDRHSTEFVTFASDLMQTSNDWSTAPT